MINADKLTAILAEYKKVFVSRQWGEEKYKWEAVKHFQDNWDVSAPDFAEMLVRATNKTGNLLASMNYYPRGMLRQFAGADAEAVRAMFINLYDETKDLVGRVEKFQSDANALKDRYDDGTWKQHYQNPNSISTYLWLRYPDKYYIYKYSECRATARELDSSFVPKRGASSRNLIGGFALCDEISRQLATDTELVEMLRAAITEECYPDPELKTLTIDICYYISRHYPKRVSEGASQWFPHDYAPGISVDQWSGLLSDKSVFTPGSLEIVKRMKDYGGAATFKQLSFKYGETDNFYDAGSSSLAKRVAEKTGCSVMTDETENPKWWPILYVGKHVDNEAEGVCTWKLRDELSEALDKADLSSVRLHADKPTDKAVRNYWWLNANPKIWSLSSLDVGGVQSYSLYNDSGNKRRIFQNFLDADAGDPIIGYESNPVKQVVALAKVLQKTDGVSLSFEKVESLVTPIDYATLKNYPELESMEYFISPQGSLFKLTKEEYDFIMEIVRDDNPLAPVEPIEPYSRESFLGEVYITGESFDALVSLLRNKQNLILQGAPGVGKTFVAKRLAYAIMGRKDDSRVEFVQFHQSYSYEDFVMGYKPRGDGFELQYGVFYRFCRKAANRPDLPFFFIIDEINRGNMSKIFGELLMLIERDYRGTKATLAYSGMQFAVPKNLYIIGMMNTADRSLAMIDYALRRRFGFFEMNPGFASDGFKTYQQSLDDDTLNVLIDLIKELNKEITADGSLGSGFCIGHSYFCGRTECTDEWLKEVVEYEILPMLKEYWFDEPAKVQRWGNILRGVFND